MESNVIDLTKLVERTDMRIDTIESRLSVAEQGLAAVQVGLERVHGDLKVNNQLTVNMDSSLSTMQKDISQIVSMYKGAKEWRVPLAILIGVLLSMSSAMIAAVKVFAER